MRAQTPVPENGDRRVFLFTWKDVLAIIRCSYLYSGEHCRIRQAWPRQGSRHEMLPHGFKTAGKRRAGNKNIRTTAGGITQLQLFHHQASDPFSELYRTMICSKVQITGPGVSQLDGERITVTVPKEDIRRIKLSYDPRSKHPFLRFLGGFGLIVSGLVLLIAAFIMVEVGVLFVRLASYTFSIPVVPISLWLMVGAGLWLLLGVFRGRYLLFIATDQGFRKIFFEESTDIGEILRFIERANRELAYNIDISITDTMYIKHGASGHQHGDQNATP